MQRTRPARRARGRRRSQSGRGTIVPRPETLAKTLPYSAARSSCSRHTGSSSGPIGGFPRWSMTSVSAGCRRASSGTSSRWSGKTAGSSSSKAALLEQRERGLHLVTEQPVRVALLVDEMADRAELRLGGQLVEAPARGAGVVEPAPGGDRTDPRRLFDELEQIIGVAIVAAALCTTPSPDTARGEQRLEVARLERPVDGARARRSSTPAGCGRGSRSDGGRRRSLGYARSCSQPSSSPRPCGSVRVGSRSNGWSSTPIGPV